MKPEPVLCQDSSDVGSPGSARPRVVLTRMLIGLMVLICAEVFSGASLKVGLWHPWTVLVTYWLYFAHFFLFTTLAVRTGRTSLTSLYLWGVLFGLYESWITKVIWSGYGGDGHVVLGRIGPYGFSEISMVFIFHPVVSFILPLTVACLVCPSLRGLFPDLAWFTGRSKGARLVQVYLILSFAPVMAINSGGAINLVLNLVAAIALLTVLLRLTRPTRAGSDGRNIVVFGRWGLGGLCAYLALLYGVGYVALRPEALPSAAVQGFTLVFYALAGGGLWLHRRREPLVDTRDCPVEPRERRSAAVLFGVLLALALGLAMGVPAAVLYPAIAVNFVAWTLAGFGLTGLSLARGGREWFLNRAARQMVPGDGDSG